MHRQNKLAVAFSLFSFTFLAGVARAEILEFTATIDGPASNACAGSGSPGTGTGIFTLDTITGIVNYNISYSDMIGTELLTVIHGPAPECVTTTPGYNLPSGNPKIGTQTLNAAEQADMINNLHYVNIHTTFNASGELRGQVILVEPVPAVSEWGIVVLTIMVLVTGTILLGRRRRLV